MWKLFVNLKQQFVFVFSNLSMAYDQVSVLKDEQTYKNLIKLHLGDPPSEAPSTGAAQTLILGLVIMSSFCVLLRRQGAASVRQSWQSV